ncbi:fluoride efflux transporter FluC [Halopiger goleimassiliensis]|uniref:fluoride efflux transporter FluC n=1 Tax=Halopiger goleimassiliensis TaxID=1293048 RepID=UPI0006782262|nr:CrcB family protein [Halopiger goleimassiliensis]
MTARHPLVRLETFALIGIGGFAGANLRLFATGIVPEVPGVLLVNALGSFVLGFLAYEAEYADLLDRRSRLVFTTGFLSSLTTYSTFAVQASLAAEPWLLGAIVVGNYGFGFGGVLAGRALARWITTGIRATAGGETA